MFTACGQKSRQQKDKGERGGGRAQLFGDEAKLLRQLLRGYEKNTRPVANASHTIVVQINFALTQILDMVRKVPPHCSHYRAGFNYQQNEKVVKQALHVNSFQIW